jgi:hypothetical protein
MKMKIFVKTKQIRRKKMNKNYNKYVVALSLTVVLSLTLNVLGQNNEKSKERSIFDFGKEIIKTVQKGNQPKQSGSQTQTSESGKSMPENQTNVLNTVSKRSGYIRFGIVSAGGETAADAHSLAATVKLIEMLDGKDFAPFDTVILQSKNPIFISAEATKKQCDFILYIEDVTNKVHKSMLNNFVTKVGNVVPFVPGILPSYDYWRIYQAGQKVMNAGDLMTAIAGNTKAKDKVSVTYKLVSVNSKTDVISKTIQEKVATKDGENVLDSIVVKIAEEVLSKTAKN